MKPPFKGMQEWEKHCIPLLIRPMKKVYIAYPHIKKGYYQTYLVLARQYHPAGLGPIQSVLLIGNKGKFYTYITITDDHGIVGACDALALMHEATHYSMEHIMAARGLVQNTFSLVEAQRYFPHLTPERMKEILYGPIPDEVVKTFLDFPMVTEDFAAMQNAVHEGRLQLTAELVQKQILPASLDRMRMDEKAKLIEPYAPILQIFLKQNPLLSDSAKFLLSEKVSGIIMLAPNADAYISCILIIARFLAVHTTQQASAARRRIAIHVDDATKASIFHIAQWYLCLPDSVTADVDTLVAQVKGLFLYIMDLRTSPNAAIAQLARIW